MGFAGQFPHTSLTYCAQERADPGEDEDVQAVSGWRGWGGFHLKAKAMKAKTKTWP